MSTQHALPVPGPGETAVPAAAALAAPLTPSTPSGPGSGPTQGETVALTLAAVTVAAAGLYFARSVVGPAFFALTLVITIRPLVVWLRRRGAPAWMASLAGIGTVVLLVLGLFGALGVAITQLVDTLPRYGDKFTAIWAQVLDLLTRVGITQDSLLTQVTSAFDTGRIVSLAQSVLLQVSNVGSLLLLLLLTVVFLTFDTATITTRSSALARLKPEIHEAMSGFARSVRSYWLVSTVFGLIVAVLDVIALTFLGVPMAVTWGVVSFITNYIPNIGFVLGVIPPALLALVTGGPWTVLWVVVAYSVLNFVIQTLIQPKFTGDAVGLNTTATFLSLMFWSLVIGGLGTILAVPLTLFTKALLVDADPRSRWLSIFVSAGDSAVLDPGPAEDLADVAGAAEEEDEAGAGQDDGVAAQGVDEADDDPPRPGR